MKIKRIFVINVVLCLGVTGLWAASIPATSGNPYGHKRETQAAATSSVEKGSQTVFELENSESKHVFKGEWDLDGDGSKERIRLVFHIKYGDWYSEYDLTVGQSSICCSGDNFLEAAYVCDLDKKDKCMELAVVDLGPSDDPVTEFFRFDGNSLRSIGKIESSIRGMNIEGGGVLSAICRGRILQTWYFPVRFALIENGNLTEIADKFYPADWPLTVKQPLSLQKSPTDPDIAMTLEIGEKVTITGTDNVEWCRIRNSKGVEGYIAIDHYTVIRGTGKGASFFFDGLCNAD